jgi:WD repeat-containing protein 90
MGRINSILCINDKYLSTASDDGSVNIWSMFDRERLVQFEVKSISATCQTLLPFENNKILQKLIKYIKTANNKTPLIIVGYSDGSVRIFDIDRKCIATKLKPFSDEITSINYCKNTCIILAGSIEGQIAVLDLNQGTTTRIINDHKSAPITCLDSFFNTNKQMTCWLAASQDRRVSVWSSKLNEDIFQIIDWLTFPFVDQQQQKNLKELATTNDKQTKKLYWNKFPNTLAYFAPNDTIVYVGNLNKKEILFYNFIKKQIIRTMDITEWPEFMCISPRTNLIAFGTKSRLLQLKDYNCATFQDYAQHSDTVTSVCFSNDGKKLFSTAFNEIFIWDVVV